MKSTPQCPHRICLHPFTRAGFNIWIGNESFSKLFCTPKLSNRIRWLVPANKAKEEINGSTIESLFHPSNKLPLPLNKTRLIATFDREPRYSVRLAESTSFVFAFPQFVASIERRKWKESAKVLSNCKLNTSAKR